MLIRFRTFIRPFLLGALFVLGLVTLGTPARGQDYLWPTNASRSLTSSFAETRPTHFHSGIDIKTWGREGYDVYATRDGYIWKVRTSPFGYGKVVYQVLDTGEIAVYAHLQKFSPYIERLIKRRQLSQKRFSVSRNFKPHEFPVSKGDLIAYTGSTGIGSPHLHFEIRQNANTPVNPLLRGFKLKDTLAPYPTGLAIIPFNLGSQVNGYPDPQTYRLIRKGRNRYAIANPVQIWGVAGFAVSGYDQANGIPNKFSVYKISLFLDDNKIFSATYDKFRFDQSGQIKLDRNSWLYAHHGRRYYNLYVAPKNDLAFYESRKIEEGLVYTAGYADSLAKQTSYLSSFMKDPFSGSPMAEFDQNYLKQLQKPYEVISAGPHMLRVILEDFNGNQSQIEVELIAEQRLSPPNQIMTFGEAEVLLSYDRERRRVFQLDGNRRWLPIDQFESIFALGQSRSPMDGEDFMVRSSPPTFKIYPEDDGPASGFPVYIVPGRPVNESDALDFRLAIRDPYVVAEITSQRPVLTPLMLFMKNSSVGYKELQLTAHNLGHYTAWFPAEELGNDSTTFILYSEADIIKEPLVETTRRIYRIEEDETAILEINGASLTVPSGVSNQDLFIEMAAEPRSQADLPPPGDSLSLIYHFKDHGAALLRTFELAIPVYKGLADLTKIGIYAPDLRKRKWNMVSNTLSKDGTAFVAAVRSLGTFALVQDTQPPQIRFLYPGRGQTIRSKTPLIRIQYEDDLSNLGGEDHYQVTIDSVFHIAELDPEKKQFMVQVDEPLTEGKHVLQVWVQDRAQNEVTRTNTFIVAKPQ